MSTSRRKFLKASMLAALFAATPLRSVLGQSWKDRDGNPGEVPATQNDPLSTYSRATFRSYVDSIFQLHTTFGIVEVSLSEISDLPAPRGGECFTLHFRGGSRTLRQGTYVLVHPSLGTFSLLLVPTGSDPNGAQGYLATINRLSYVDLINNPAPSRLGFGTTKTEAPTALPTPTPTPAEVAPVLTTPVLTPATATPTPKVNRKPGRKKKPSWKNVDQRIN